MNVTWKKSPANTIQNDLNSISQMFSSRNNLSDRRNTVNLIKDAYKTAQRTTLNDRLWARIQNSRSFYSSSLQQVMSNSDADPTDTLKQFISGSVECPIILETKDGMMLLAKGETVLSLARLLKVVPKAYILQMDI